MGAHTVGHHKQMAAAAPLLLVPRRHGGVGVLIMATLDTHIRQACVFYVVKASHPSYPGWPFCLRFVYRTPGKGSWIVPTPELEGPPPWGMSSSQAQGEASSPRVFHKPLLTPILPGVISPTF